MPPALSDEEASDGEFDLSAPTVSRRDEEDDEADKDSASDVRERSASKRSTPKQNATTQNDEDEDEDEEDEDGDLDEDEFIVEKILGHMVDTDNTLKFKVKWEGYEKKSDQTWEPEDSLREGASLILDTYLAEIGGRDAIFKESEAATSRKKRGRASNGTPGNQAKKSRRDAHPMNGEPPASAKEAAWMPPAGSWDDHIESVDVCQDESQRLIVFVNWKNGRKTKHDTSVVYKRCPQKMLQFYEMHIRVIKNTAEDSNEDQTSTVTDVKLKSDA